MPGLKITLLQQPLVWMDGPANLRHFDRLLETITGRDVIVLPEMFTTGFAVEAALQSLPQEDAIDWLNLTATFIAMINAICSAWRMNIIITRRAINVLSLNGAAGVFCR